MVEDTYSLTQKNKIYIVILHPQKYFIVNGKNRKTILFIYVLFSLAILFYMSQSASVIWKMQ